MENEDKKPEKTVGEIGKRRELMADGQRYIIYYTFGEEETAHRQTKERDNV